MSVAWSQTSNAVLDGRRAVLVGFPVCSAGEIFVFTVDDFKTGEFVLHSISKSGDAKTYRALSIPGFTALGTPTRFFAGPSYVAELTTGQKAKLNSLSNSDDNSKPLIVVFHRDGSFAGAFNPPDDVSIKAIGVFEKTAHVLILSTGNEDKRARLNIYDAQGEQVNTYFLWDDDPNTAPGAKARQPLGDALVGGALEFAQIAAVGEDLLLVPTLSSQPVLWLSEHGLTRTTAIKLPSGFALQSILDASSIPWLVKTFSSVKQDPPVMTPGPLLMVNPFDGSIQGTIISSDRKHSISCEKDGTFFGLTTDPASGVMQIGTGAIQR